MFGELRAVVRVNIDNFVIKEKIETVKKISRGKRRGGSINPGKSYFGK